MLSRHHPSLARAVLLLAGVPWVGRSADPATLTAGLNSATQLEEQGKYPEAARILAELVRETQGLTRPDPMSGLVHHRLGSVYHSQGRYPEAERQYVAALKEFRRAPGANDHAVVSALLSLSALYLETGRFAKAAQLGLEKAIEGTNLSQDSPDQALVADALASLAFAQGRFAESERGYRRAVAAWEKARPNGVELMRSLNNLGHLYHRMGRLADARLSYQRALEVARLSLPVSHPEHVKILANAGAVELAVAGPAEAERYFREAIEICEHSFAADHPVLGQMLMNYAEVLTKANRKRDARHARERGYAILKAAAKADPEHYVVALDQLGRPANAKLGVR